MTALTMQMQLGEVPFNFGQGRLTSALRNQPEGLSACPFDRFDDVFTVTCLWPRCGARIVSILRNDTRNICICRMSSSVPGATRALYAATASHLASVAMYILFHFAFPSYSSPQGAPNCFHYVVWPSKQVAACAHSGLDDERAYSLHKGAPTGGLCWRPDLRI